MTQIPKLYKLSTQKENVRPIYFMNIDTEILNKNSHKLNPGTHQRNYPSRSSRLHFRDAWMIQYKKIHQSNPLYKQTEKNPHRIISLDPENKL